MPTPCPGRVPPAAHRPPCRQTPASAPWPPTWTSSSASSTCSTRTADAAARGHRPSLGGAGQDRAAAVRGAASRGAPPHCCPCAPRRRSSWPGRGQRRSRGSEHGPRRAGAERRAQRGWQRRQRPARLCWAPGCRGLGGPSAGAEPGEGRGVERERDCPQRPHRGAIPEPPPTSERAQARREGVPPARSGGFGRQRGRPSPWQQPCRGFTVLGAGVSPGNDSTGEVTPIPQVREPLWAVGLPRNPCKPQRACHHQ